MLRDLSLNAANRDGRTASSVNKVSMPLRHNDSLLRVLEVLHTHAAVFVPVQSSEHKFLGKVRGCSLELRERDVSSTTPSAFIGHVWEPRAFFNSFCCSTAP